MRTDRALDEQRAAFCLNLLAPEEQERYQRLPGEAQRQLFLLAHVFLRHALSSHFDVPLRTWRYEYGPQGRPEISRHHDLPLPRFNLSYSRGYVACAITQQADIGVDIEVVQPTESIRKTARRYLSKDELDTLRCLSGQEYVSRFLVYWTLKEAYLKSRGTGFTKTPSAISFHVDDGRALRLRINPLLDENPSAWQFASFHPTALHVTALAVKRNAEVPFEIIPYSLESPEMLSCTELK